VSDILNHTIRKIAPQGTNWVVTTIAGSAGNPGFADGTNSDAQFDRPNGIAIDKAGNLFVADHYNHTIRKISADGTNWIVTTIAGVALAHGAADGTNTDARFWSPTGLALDVEGNIFVADTANFTIRQVKQFGTNWAVTTLAGSALNFGFVDGTNTDAQFDYPYGVSVAGTNRLFVSDWGNHSIRQVTRVGSDWVVTTIAGTGDIGSSDGSGTVASFNFPNGICTDIAGKVFLSDQSNDTIRELVLATNDWLASTIAGTALQIGTSDGFGADVRFRHPWGVVVNEVGEVFVTDYGNQTIRKGVFRPVLRMSMAVGRLALSWPRAAAQFTVEASSSLDANAAWLSVTNAPVTNGLTVFLPVEPSSGAAFYRLRRQ
jgi:hypothetical protein